MSGLEIAAQARERDVLASFAADIAATTADEVACQAVCGGNDALTLDEVGRCSACAEGSAQ